MVRDVTEQQAERAGPRLPVAVLQLDDAQKIRFGKRIQKALLLSLPCVPARS